MALNLERQMVFYGQYHHDPTNVIIHMTCVPILLVTGLLLATNTPSLLPLPEWLSIEAIPPNLGVIVSFIFGTVYVLMEPVAGSMLAPLVVGSALYGTHLTATYGSTALIYAAGVHGVSWIAQFIGHGKFEGRAPALLDNLVQAVVLAPLFVWLEFLFSVGYRPELKKRLDSAISQELTKYRASKKTGANGKTN